MKNTLGLFYEKYTLYLLTQEWTTTSKVKCYGINMDFCISQCGNLKIFTQIVSMSQKQVLLRLYNSPKLSVE